MEEPKPLTSRKRKRHDWWAKHRPKEGKVLKKSDKTDKPVKTSEKKKQTSEATGEENEQAIDKLDNKDKNKRYILKQQNIFITADESVQVLVIINSYSVCLSIDNIKEFRLMTKKSGESKGCGFIEFGDKASYWKALNLHHSVLAGRKINVEVTCGGGGKGENRVKKLQQCKLKFQQGRKRRSTTSTKVKSKQKDDTSCNT
ncbi:uncharacterized RNA-binding protein C365.04c-like [Pocillopora damicornis]|uniref:uncharacterized RNA-binding protein C365.04c-like n=1 Tax=Pocillopora damicornis TaxID=46731 RepID=UPI000F551CB3|nr:uncharacterized RNA-binding protein C365.04c-like [Pocillopora damicornis]